MNIERRPQRGRNNLWFKYNESDAALVFLHGILSESRSCWLYESKGRPQRNCYWPELVESDSRFLDISIYLAGYYTAPDSGEYEIRNCAHEVLAALKRKDVDGHPPVMEKAKITFVCHSMGGIVARYLLEANHQEFKDKKVGLVLIASPSYGSNLANSLDALIDFFYYQQGVQLRWGAWNLQDLDDRFKELKEHKHIPNLFGIELYENHFIIHVKWFPMFKRKLVVAKESAGRYFGAPKLIPHTDHFTICKPQNIHDLVHQYLYDFLSGNQLLPSEAGPLDLASMGLSETVSVKDIQLTGNPRSGPDVPQGAGAEKMTRVPDIPRPIEGQPSFETARHKAKQLSNFGRNAEASEVLMDALQHEDQLERERQDNQKQLRLRFIEEALLYDQKADRIDVAVDKLRQIAEIVHPGDSTAKNTYLRRRAAEYCEIGRNQGEKSALLIAYETLRGVTEDNS